MDLTFSLHANFFACFVDIGQSGLEIDLSSGFYLCFFVFAEKAI